LAGVVMLHDQSLGAEGKQDDDHGLATTAWQS
jgi:hypothetical protein